MKRDGSVSLTMATAALLLLALTAPLAHARVAATQEAASGSAAPARASAAPRARATPAPAGPAARVTPPLRAAHPAAPASRPPAGHTSSTHRPTPPLAVHPGGGASRSLTLAHSARGVGPAAVHGRGGSVGGPASVPHSGVLGGAAHYDARKGAVLGGAPK